MIAPKRTYDVLYADDEKMLRDMMKRLERVYPLLSIRTATDGQDAAKQMQEKLPDFLVTDYNMPNLNGIELIEIARGKLNYKNGIVLVTGQPDDAQKDFVSKNIKDVVIISKPFKPMELGDLIMNTLQ